jgi:type IV pilus assembly protein PilA
MVYSLRKNQLKNALGAASAFKAKRFVQSGFTLLELMVVVTIIGILAAVAIPRYQDYTIRTRVAEALVLSVEIQKTVAQYYDRWGVLPVDNAAAGLPPPEALRGMAVDAISVSQGVVAVQFSKSIAVPTKDGAKPSTPYGLVIRPAIRADSPTSPVSWVCQGASVPDGVVVPEMPSNLAVLDKRYVPANCRSPS